MVTYFEIGLPLNLKQCCDFKSIHAHLCLPPFFPSVFFFPILAAPFLTEPPNPAFFLLFGLLPFLWSSLEPPSRCLFRCFLYRGRGGQEWEGKREEGEWEWWREIASKRTQSIVLVSQNWYACIYLFSASAVALLAAFVTSRIGFPFDNFSRMSKFFCFSVVMSPTTVANCGKND